VFEKYQRAGKIDWKLINFDFNANSLENFLMCLRLGLKDRKVERNWCRDLTEILVADESD
jgi:hypothetical protein